MREPMRRLVGSGMVSCLVAPISAWPTMIWRDSVGYISSDASFWSVFDFQRCGTLVPGMAGSQVSLV